MHRGADASLNRRGVLRSGGAAFAALALAGCATSRSLSASRIALAPVRASVDRLFDITVCLRPFRPQGPRIEAEQLGRALIVHNYGHGGSGWSLSWGSGTIALRLAMASSPKEVAVIGCGALGLTSAILAQEAGAKVTIYAKELLPDTRSARATGSWTPDSRIALSDKTAPSFGDLWEEMARISFHRYRRYLGLPGNPVEWTDRYYLSDGDGDGGAPAAPAPQELDFASYRDRIRDIEPHSEELPPGSTPFPTRFVRRNSLMQFNIADYGHILVGDFLAAGGRFERHEFHELAELAQLKENVVINCTGYGARALCKDESIVPVRGQIGWLIPQPEVNYGVFYEGVSVLSRRDGIVVQDLAGGDMRGYNDSNETIDRDESMRAVETIASLYARMNMA
jgi:glycine/D-amino acid oxidase-like deaminating enzyme